MNSPFIRPETYLERRQVHGLAPANDTECRHRVPSAERFADAIGKAMVALSAASFAGLIVSLVLDAPAAAWLFTGSMASSSITTILVDVFKARLFTWGQHQ